MEMARFIKFLPERFCIATVFSISRWSRAYRFSGGRVVAEFRRSKALSQNEVKKEKRESFLRDR